MAARDYKKLYNALQDSNEILAERCNTLHEENTNLMGKYSRLDDEFTKAVHSNRRYQEQLLEQRGIIGFLESKITKLMESMDDY